MVLMGFWPFTPQYQYYKSALGLPGERPLLSHESRFNLVSEYIFTNIFGKSFQTEEVLMGFLSRSCLIFLKFYISEKFYILKRIHARWLFLVSKSLPRFILKLFRLLNKAIYTDLDHHPEGEKSAFKSLRPVNGQHVLHVRKELLHGLRILEVDLTDQSIKALTTSAPYLCRVSQ